jgi:hypothetical protein
MCDESGLTLLHIANTTEHVDSEEYPHCDDSLPLLLDCSVGIRMHTVWGFLQNTTSAYTAHIVCEGWDQNEIQVLVDNMEHLLSESENHKAYRGPQVVHIIHPFLTGIRVYSINSQGNLRRGCGLYPLITPF